MVVVLLLAVVGAGGGGNGVGRGSEQKKNKVDNFILLENICLWLMSVKEGNLKWK